MDSERFGAWSTFFSRSVVALACLAIFTQCAKPKDPSLSALLSKNGVFAEDSLYSCLLNLYYQGIPLKQAQEECAVKLLEDDKKGFGGNLGYDPKKGFGRSQGIDTPLGKIGPGTETYFDPSKITAACNAGDPKVGQSSGYSNWPGKGEYTWGGDPRYYYGYSQKESYQLKEEAVKASEKAYKELQEAIDNLENAKKEAEKERRDARKSGEEKSKKSQETEKKLQDLYQKALDKQSDAQLKSEEAESDPNEKPMGVSRTAGGETPCEQALQGAREFLRECHRTGWRATECRQLQAKINHCPDPTMIYVDPEQGYSCGAKLDKEALKDAWVTRCEQLKRPVPGGGNPCAPPTFDNPGRYIQEKIGDIVCRGDPYAYIDPDSKSCLTEFEIKPFGEPDIQKILVFVLNKFGGPTVVIPVKDQKPSPKPGPQPRPGPSPKD